MFKNVASQKIILFAFDGTTGAGKTGETSGTLTGYVNKDYAGPNALNDTTPTEIDSTKAPGCYLFDLLQAETNADALHFTGKSTNSNINVVPVYLFTTPPNFTTLNIDGSGNVVIPASIRPGIRKNTALNNFGVLLTDSTTHAAATGKTSVTVTRSIDGGAFAAISVTTVTELSGGWYFFNLSSSDLNGDIILLHITCTGCDDVNIEVRTAP